MWLLFFIAEIGVLVLLASIRPITEAHPPLQLLGLASVAAIFATLPVLALKLFIAGQLKIGNGDHAMVRGLRRHQTAVVFGVWVLIVAALIMAGPAMLADIRAERAANAAASGVASVDSTSTPSVDPPAANESTIPVTTPGVGSTQRTAIMDAVRQRLNSKSRFKVDHIRVAGTWAFVRATEVVPLANDELQETDLTVAALLELPAGSTTGWWRVADYWTLPDNDTRPLADFVRTVRARLRAERLPAALLPDDL
jgi:hypothetical protein